MSSIPHNQNKEKGIPVMTIFRYLLCLLFSDRSDYYTEKNENFWRRILKKHPLSFSEQCENNKGCFTVLLSSKIINDFMKPLTDEKRKDVFIIDDSLFDRSQIILTIALWSIKKDTVCLL